jgi:predicted RNA binding protein YcfA (HicA-like mRNA interferase family)
MPAKIRDLIRMVERDGWLHVRTTGSHRHYRHPTKPGTVTIPGHPSDDAAIGTERSIVKQAGLERKKG